MERKTWRTDELTQREWDEFCSALVLSGYPRQDLPDAHDKLSALSVLDLKKDDLLIQEGEQASEVFVIVSGLVGVYRKLQSGKEANVAMIGPGALQGEIGVLTGMPRFATVKAEAPTRCFAVSQEDFRHLIEVSPKFRDQVDRLFTRRMEELAKAGG